jgi:hypothetical protein
VRFAEHRHTTTRRDVLVRNDDGEVDDSHEDNEVDDGRNERTEVEECRRIARLPELHAEPDGVSTLGPGDKRVDHRIGKGLYQRAQGQGHDQTDGDDDDVASQEKVLESLDHVRSSFFLADRLTWGKVGFSCFWALGPLDPMWHATSPGRVPGDQARGKPLPIPDGGFVDQENPHRIPGRDLQLLETWRSPACAGDLWSVSGRLRRQHIDDAHGRLGRSSVLNRKGIDLMAIVMFLELPGVTTEQYDKLNEAMGIAGPEDEHEGLISHICATTDTGLLICDVWRSQEDLDDFQANTLGPAAAKLGVPPGPPPRIAPLHHEVRPR